MKPVHYCNHIAYKFKRPQNLFLVAISLKKNTLGELFSYFMKDETNTIHFCHDKLSCNCEVKLLWKWNMPQKLACTLQLQLWDKIRKSVFEDKERCLLAVQGHFHRLSINVCVPISTLYSNCRLINTIFGTYGKAICCKSGVWIISQIFDWSGPMHCEKFQKI